VSKFKEKETPMIDKNNKTSASRVCTKCILPDTFPGIQFNAEGVCNFCLDNKSTSVLGEAKLKEILQSEKGEIYDCVVPLSGGKDSTYILFYAAEVLKLKVIAVNYDSGLQASMSMQNMKDVCSRLNIPLVIIKADEKVQKNMLRMTLLVSETVGRFYGGCGNCGTNIKTVAINTAKKYKVPFVLYGQAKDEDTDVAHTNLRSVLIHMFPKNLFKLSLILTKFFYYNVRQRMQLKVPLKYRFQPLANLHIVNGEKFCNKGTPHNETKFINFFEYMEWDVLKIANFLKEHIGWKHPEEREGRFDCLVHCLGNHRCLHEFGISSDGIIYANIFQGKIYS
jgi:3'-phosphoadenosine 5'-phosphosulfate sulfotransferase (PAPS reductase)/FAD synthetase